MRQSVVCLGFFWLSACPDPDPGKPGGGDDPFVPAEGPWIEEAAVYADDGCALADGTGTDTAFEMVVPGDGTFEIHYVATTTDDAPVVVSCTLDGRSFVCETVTSVEDTQDLGFDAVITAVTNASGAFTSETEGEIEAAIAVSCVGADCAEFAPLDDCTSSGTAAIVAD